MTAARVFDQDGGLAGTIERHGTDWRALDLDGRRLGSFPTQAEAAGAVLRVRMHETARRDARSEELLAAALDDMAGRWREEKRDQAGLLIGEAGR